MLEMVKFIYENVLDDVLFKAVNESLFNPCLGHFISTLINIAINDKYFKIRNEVIEIIDLIINRLNDYYKKTKKGFNPADLLASFLPGISQFLMKMITKDEKQNKIVYTNSLKALSSLFVCVYCNYEDGLSERLDNFQFLMPRTKEWQLKSLEKLNIIIELIERALINQSITIKESLINFSTIIIFHIVDHKENHQLLPLISRNLFKIPLTLLYDDNETVKKLSLSFTQQIIHKFSLSNQFILEELLIDDLFKLLDDFEKEISVYNEDRILINMKLLCGYLNCFESIKFNFIFLNQKDKLFNLLKLIYKFDFNRISSNVLPNEKTEFSTVDWFDKKFFYFETSKLIDQLEILCSLINKLIDYNIFNDYLIECLVQLENDSDQIFSNDDNLIKEKSTIIFILSYLIKTSNKFNQQILNRFINLLEIKLEQINNDQLFIDERFELVIFCSILIELITNFSFACKSKEEQKQFFILILYRIMACTGSTHLQIQINSKSSIIKLTKILNYKSIKEMILDNIDYVISNIQIKLNNYNDKENLYFVFRILFEYTDIEICTFLEKTINNLLITLDINYSIINFERLARILLLVIKTFKRWFFKENDFKIKKIAIDDNDIKLNEFKDDLIKFIDKRNKDKEEFKKIEDELNDNNDLRKIINEDDILDEELTNRNEEIVNEESEPLPIHIDFTKKILEKCSNFLSYNSLNVRLIILDIIIDGLDILRLHEDSLLPTAHTVWESLIYRFKDEPIILFKCTECLIKLSISCGDFIRSRTIKQVLPQIYSFLKLNFKKSIISNVENSSLAEITNKFKPSVNVMAAKNSTNAYFFSLEYRLQLLLLDNLGKLAFNIKLMRKDLWQLISTLKQYLNDNQPLELRTAAYSSLKELEYLDIYSVYYFKNYY